MAESERELKSLLKVKEESEKAGLKLNIQKTKIIGSSPITWWWTDEETMATVTDFIFLGSKITVDDDCSHEIKRCLLFGRKAMTNLDSSLKSRDITLPRKICIVKAMAFPVIITDVRARQEKKGWASKNQYLQNVVLEKTLQSPLHSKEIKPVDHKGNKPWILIWRTGVEAETPILWPPDVKSPLIGRDPDSGKDWKQKEKRVAEAEMVR